MDLQSLCVELRKLAADCIREAESRNVFFAFAESCTGGLLGAMVTDHEGASAAFAGSAVTYSNEAKEKILGVPREIIERYGAVSEPCARVMAEGARNAYDTDIAVSVTGVAGPLGGSPEKPVGTVWFGVSHAGGRVSAFCRHFEGGREAVRLQAAREVFLSLLALLHGQ